ncbi:tRNA (adenosine(37)-N6)-dimethylallyltransferase MiaA [Buchnera aphidicola]|uniref:tRNA dimethylallyltransferase n=2 Tax=Buchnera aphidicola TaxID=9 RepID=MIAA_BUCA5|nr:tRNA (adenosine(37)-N6)-dimethylallyltransferase MiaA [Buchnera aphidicola]B8D890.1 RecName: Full=tRNA dimethylallyltransferase; AltName: Full=Dimethylallyl diphosphate:tRNA dimethylallyltransferase; Short=DMAPP:tRNA dimethylallyltransferase; Short=DMATase; AltName: Full=Isopentenyl-diphosphate:tRNA isopentenyltransferase; Short=IPP transferase; Short=IPPT; Short=IPTase [Buchnera aphidicola str. Tuc7 (Acyrthosiphon pisum)]B8D8D3.1 RecName: Full=tRNA dimethylallyltransferase; AltName: Full=Dime
MGPTACGKSQLAICLRKYLSIELISVDSALIYRGMDIGTDKPSFSDLYNHPHRLLNIKDPVENYSAAEFQKDVLREIDEIIKLGKIPCLVGGSMFYYNVLLHGLSILPPSNIKLREYLIQKSYEKNYLYKKLKLIDPISASRIHKNDFQRLIRALEIFYLSGKSLTELKKKNNYKLPYNIFQFAIIPPNKEWLNNKIELRIKKMLMLGFQKEVEILFLRGDLHKNLPSIRCIGYRQMWEYLEYKNSYKDMFNKTIHATRKLAKHQLTWLKNWKNINKIEYHSTSTILAKKVLDVLEKNDFSV